MYQNNLFVVLCYWHYLDIKKELNLRAKKKKAEKKIQKIGK